MKRMIYLPVLLLFLLGGSCSQSVDPGEERSLITAVNEEERDAFFERDLNRLEDIWIQESSSRRYFRSRDRITVLDGWEQIYSNYRSSIEGDMWTYAEDLTADYYNYEIIVYGNTAMIYHDVLWTGKIRGENIIRKQKRVGHLVKVRGQWKFDYTSQIDVPSMTED